MGKSLLNRVQATCTQRGISLVKYICNEDDAKKIVREQKMFTNQDGLVDTIRFLLEDFTDANRILLKGLVSQSF